MKEIRLMLVEDHQLVREALRSFFEIEDGFEVVAESGDAAEALAKVAIHHPDVVIADIRLANGDGIELCRDVRSAFPDVRCLILTGLPDESLVVEAILAGAAAFVTKGVGFADLAGIVKGVANGETFMDPGTAYNLVDSLRREMRAREKGALTPQEERTLELISHGLTNREIAERLSLAEQTVKNYVSSVLTKLGLERRTQAAVYATRLALRPDN